MYSCWFTCNQDQNEIKQSRPSKTYNQVIKHAVFSVTIKSTRVLLVRLDPIKICTHAHSRACMLVTLHVCISKVSIHLDLGRRWINSCILGDYPLFFYSILDLFLHTRGILLFCCCFSSFSPVHVGLHCRRLNPLLSDAFCPGKLTSVLAFPIHL